jgi:hypothetical protein
MEGDKNMSDSINTINVGGVDKLLEDIQGRINLTTEAARLDARIDNIIGSPAPTAEEIQDARVGADGTIYNTLGNAIRTQVKTINDEIYDVDNLLFSSKYHPNMYYNSGAVVDDEYSYFEIPIEIGETYYISPAARFIAMPSSIVAQKTKGVYTYVATYTGTLYVTFYNNIPGWVVTKSSDVDKVRCFNWQDIVYQDATHPFNPDTDNLLFDPSTVHIKNKYYNTIPVEHPEYDYFVINVESGQSYYIYPGYRFICKEGEGTLYPQQDLPLEFTADFNGPLYITMRKSTPGWIITKNSSPDGIVPYFYYVDNYSKFWGKSILNIGDSIATNRSESRSYSRQFADKTGAVVRTDYAQSGSTLSLTEDQGERGSIYSQALQVVTDHPREAYDIIMIDGGTNDYGMNRSVGNIVGTPGAYTIDDYTATFNETKITGALEAIFQMLRNQYVNSIIVFVIPHKNQRTGEYWESILDAIRTVCEKWSIIVLDMDKDGELNTRITAMRASYTDASGTHPNTEGIKKYYLPRLIELLGQYF